jgi:tetratricopeptide (TPR) repeat protein
MACSAIAVAQEGDLDTDAARALFKRGTMQYAAGHYRDALGMFEQAKAIRPLPAFDFNIAKCHEQLGELAAAIAAYERYAATQPGDVDEVRARVADLRARMPPPPAVASPPPVASPPTATPTPSAAPPSSHRSRTLTIAGAVTGGAGLALVAAGIGLGVDGDKRADALTAADLNHRPFDVSVEQKLASDRAGEIALCTIGAVAAATGVVLIVLGRRAHARAYAWSAR